MSHEWTMYTGCKTRKNNAMTWLWPVYHNNVEKLKTAFLSLFFSCLLQILNCLELRYEKLKIIFILYTYKSTNENICLKIKWNEYKKEKNKSQRLWYIEELSTCNVLCFLSKVIVEMWNYFLSFCLCFDRFSNY